MPPRPTSPDIGDQPVLFCDVFSATDPSVPANPTNGRILIMRPNGDVTAYGFGLMIVAPGGKVGRVEFTLPYPLDASGQWGVRWEFTAGVVAAEEFGFAVRKRTVPAPS